MTGHIGPGTGLHPPRPEQRSGRVRRRADPNGLSGLSVSCIREHQGAVRKILGRGTGSERRPHSRRDHASDPRRPDTRDVHNGRKPGDVGPDAQHAREALASLDHLVVQDLFLTETAALADVVASSERLPGKRRHLHQHQPSGAARPRRALSRATRARTSGSSRRSRGASGWTGTTTALPTSSPRWRSACIRSTASPGSACRTGLRDLPGGRTRCQPGKSSSPAGSRPRTGAASSCQPTFCRRQKCRTPTIR